MLFSRRLPLPALIQLCRSLKHNLGAGIMLRDVFRQQAQRGTASVRPVADRIAQALTEGDNLTTALRRETALFPPLFLSLTEVGEESGNLPEVCGELEKYYQLQRKFWQQFISQSILPVLQFVAATFVIALLLVILGWIADSNPGSKPLEPIGLGLTGARGAVVFLGTIYGTIAALVAGYAILSRSLEQKAIVDRVLLRLPVVGAFLWDLCLNRFCVGLRLTMDSSMPMADALDLSLRATGNAAFISKSRMIRNSIMSGDDLTTALTRSKLLPVDFVNIIAVAEEGGRVPEVMGNQAHYYEEEATRKLAVLTRVAGFGIWLFVAILIIMAIFRIAGIYLNALNQAGGF
jgi:type II secretory pathway component PulF